MEWAIEDNRNLNFIKIVYRGAFSIRDAVLAAGEFSNKSDGRKIRNVLSDYREVDFSHLFINDIRKLVDRYVVNAERIGRRRIAYLIRPGLQYGVFRQFHTLMEMYTKIEVQPFYGEKEAVDWLCLEIEQAQIVN